MKKIVKILCCSFLLMAFSCDGPETIVTNYIYRDGSIKRIIEMRSFENKFQLSDIPVPYDTTWRTTDSLELNGNDTI